MLNALEHKDERRAPDPETQAAHGAPAKDRAPDAQSSTSAAYALSEADVNSELEVALSFVSDSSLPIADRAQVYALLRRIKLQIDRAIREPGRELQSLLAELAAEHGDRVQYGPLRLKWSAIDVKWPVNDPGNWLDEGVQSWLEDWAALLDTHDDDDPIIPLVPQHYEVDTGVLGSTLALAPSAKVRRFYDELKERRLRTEQGRRASIEVVD
jgi:hypothetical protein